MIAVQRMLRIELRHNAMALMVPVVAALFWFTTYRRVMAMPPLWNLRAAGVQTYSVIDFVTPLTGAAAWMGSRESRRRMADAVLITPRARWARLRTLSGGMLRRAGIAQAIVNQPDLLLLDEPTAGLDPEQRVAFRALLRELGQRATVAVSTHLVEDVGAACARVAVMDQGKIVYLGSPAGLTARGDGHDTGDAPLERGYSAVLAAARR